MINTTDRVTIIGMRVDKAAYLLRSIYKLAKKGKDIDPLIFAQVDDVIASLRHNCEMYNCEKAEDNL